jgi:4-carboxymuconolactone decarboxylase
LSREQQEYTMTDDDNRMKTGQRLRREVLGAEYVDRKATTTWPFAKPLSDLVTEFAWGAIWARPGLSRRDRSLINLGMLTALNRSDELRLHIGAALNNGLSPEEIREALLQATVYCGVPAGLEAFRCAKAVFDERGIDTSAS